MSVSSRDLQQRPASRASAAESTSSRPVYLLERCIAIRFEKIHQATLLLNKANGLPPKSNRPGSSLSSWLPWRSSSSTIRPAAAAAETAIPVAKDQAALPSLVKDSAAPAGWIYDGGFVLYQVTFYNQFVLEYHHVDDHYMVSPSICQRPLFT